MCALPTAPDAEPGLALFPPDAAGTDGLISESILLTLESSWLLTLTGTERLAAAVATPDFADFADLTDLADLALRRVSRDTWGTLAKLGRGEAAALAALERR